MFCSLLSVVLQLALLPRVEQALGKAYLAESLVENGLLQSVAEWLKPLPSGAAAPISLRQSLLRCILALPLDWSDGSLLTHLKRSQLGKASSLFASSSSSHSFVQVVMHLYRTESIGAIKQTAEKLIEIWSRPVFAINDDWRTLAQEEARKQVASPLARPQSRLARQAEDAQQEIQRKARSPRFSHFLSFFSSRWSRIASVPTRGRSCLTRARISPPLSRVRSRAKPRTSREW